MAANFIELQEEVTEEKFTDPTQEESTTPAPTENMVGQPEEAASSQELPEKYRGKALDEISRCIKKPRS